MSEWQTIDTAPKDGTWIELWRGPCEGLGEWQPLVIARWWVYEDYDSAWSWPDDMYDPWHNVDRANEYLMNGDSYVATSGFTHWRPLTTPPTS